MYHDYDYHSNNNRSLGRIRANGRLSHTEMHHILDGPAIAREVIASTETGQKLPEDVATLSG